MENFDKFLEKKFSMDAPPMPDDARKRVENLLAELPEKKRSYRRYRAVAAAVAACFCLLFSATVSAKVLGILPWEYQKSHVFGIEMEHRSYQKSSEDAGSDSVKKRISDEPLYVPEGMKETERTKGDTVLMIAWLANEESGVIYTSRKLEKGANFSIDDECDHEERIAVAGYIGTYREKTKEKESWITWDDEDYNHVIDATDIPNAKEELLKMAESMYEG